MDVYKSKIKPLFDSSGLSDSELEKEIGLPRSIIYDWNNDRNKSYKKYVDKIASYFGVSADSILVSDPREPKPRILNALQYLGNEYSLHYLSILEEHVIYRDLFNGFEIEVSNIDNSRKMYKAFISIYQYSEIDGIKKNRKVVEAFECWSEEEIKDNLKYLIPKYKDENIREILKKQTRVFTPKLEDRVFPVGGSVPVLGVIRAGAPILAEQHILGYEFADVSHPEEYFYLSVTGDSMINAGIRENSKVLVHKQNTADNGQIVVCRVNGEDATLKRFKQQGNTVVLLPENPAYEPIILSCKEFENGYAEILGVAKKVLSDL